MRIIGHNVDINVTINNSKVDFYQLELVLQENIIMSINDSILEGYTSGNGTSEDGSILYQWKREFELSFDELKETIFSFDGILDLSQINQLSDVVKKLNSK